MKTWRGRPATDSSGSDNLLAGVWALVSCKYSLFGVRHSSERDASTLTVLCSYGKSTLAGRAIKCLGSRNELHRQPKGHSRVEPSANRNVLSNRLETRCGSFILKRKSACFRRSSDDSPSTSWFGTKEVDGVHRQFPVVRWLHVIQRIN